MEKWPLGVFASIDAGLGVRLEVAHELGVSTIQLHTPQQTSRTKQRASEFCARLQELSMRVTVVFAGFEGESYADIPTVGRTVGLVPPASRAARTAEMKEIADFASLLGAEAVGLHVGELPADRQNHADYVGVLAAIQDICDHSGRLGLRVHLETGQEAADTLLQFLSDAGRDNLFVNFDPANMILYGSGDPIEALRRIGSYVRSVHCKDARWTARPGIDWGTEVPLGEGDVGMERFLGTLAELGYFGPLTIERETSPDAQRQKEEIGHGIRLLSQLKTKLLS
jgi:sugar phosphate isomerase/epimerase